MEIDEKYKETGYELDTHMDMEMEEPVVTRDKQMELKRLQAWKFVSACQECGSSDVSRFYDASADAYYVQCGAPPRNKKGEDKPELCGWTIKM